MKLPLPGNRPAVIEAIRHQAAPNNGPEIIASRTNCQSRSDLINTIRQKLTLFVAAGPRFPIG